MKDKKYLLQSIILSQYIVKFLIKAFLLRLIILKNQYFIKQCYFFTYASIFNNKNIEYIAQSLHDILNDLKNKLISCYLNLNIYKIKLCGRSSGVEHNLAKVGVEGSNPFARSIHYLNF